MLSFSRDLASFQELIIAHHESCLGGAARLPGLTE